MLTQLCAWGPSTMLSHVFHSSPGTGTRGVGPFRHQPLHEHAHARPPLEEVRRRAPGAARPAEGAPQRRPGWGLRGVPLRAYSVLISPTVLHPRVWALELVRDIWHLRFLSLVRITVDTVSGLECRREICGGVSGVQLMTRQLHGTCVGLKVPLLRCGGVQSAIGLMWLYWLR